MESHEKTAEKLYLEQAGGMYQLAFIHSCLNLETDQLFTDVLGELFTSPKALAQAQQGEHGLLKLMHNACMRYYEKKLRKKLKGELLRKQRLSFQITDNLLQILHLPYHLKSPLVLQYGIGLSREETAAVLGFSVQKVQGLLTKAQNKLGFGKGEIQAELSVVQLPLQEQELLYSRVLTESDDPAFAGKQRLKRFKRGMDHALPLAVLLVLLFALFCVLAVHFQWFGIAQLTPQTEQWLSNNSGILFWTGMKNR